MKIEGFNRWAITMMALLASVAASSVTAGQDFGEEWQSLTAAEWKIVFPAPGLENLVERHQLRENATSRPDVEVAFWVGATATYPKANIQYLKAHPERVWRSTPDPRSLGNQGWLQNKAVKFDSLKQDRNRIGRVQRRIFHFDNVNCVGFTQSWGSDENVYAGNKLIVGYYCAEPGQPLSDEMARTIVAAVDIDDNKNRRRQLLGNLSGPFSGLWTGTGNRESGSCSVPIGFGTLESIQVELIIRELEITGRIKKARIDSRSQSIGTISIDESIRGTVSENGEFDLQVGKTDLGAELVLRGRLPKEGRRASGTWDTPNCRGTLALTR